MTFPDGKIYGTPSIYDPLYMQVMLWVRKDWLEKFDMDVPRMTDEYYKYLKAVRDKHPNGTSEAIGYIEQAKLAFLRRAIMGSFGVGNRGATANNIDTEPGDKTKVRFYPISDGYKAMLEYVHGLYKDGLIAKNIFSIDAAKMGSALAKGTYGSIAYIAPGTIYGGKAKQFVPVAPLQGPDGEHSFNSVKSALTTMGNFVITNKVEYPAAVARWLDYFYSDEGAKLYNMGVKGVSYKETKDGVEYVDEITDNPKGLTEAEAKKPYVTQAGGNNPGIIKKAYYKGAESSQEQTDAAKIMEPDMLKEVWPAFTYTKRESEELDSLSDDIDKYVGESGDKLISGDMPLSDWNKYVEKIKRMELDDYVEIKQAAYDRYRKA